VSSRCVTCGVKEGEPSSRSSNRSAESGPSAVASPSSAASGINCTEPPEPALAPAVPAPVLASSVVAGRFPLGSAAAAAAAEAVAAAAAAAGVVKESSSAADSVQGLTLVHYAAQRKHTLWDTLGA